MTVNKLQGVSLITRNPRCLPGTLSLVFLRVHGILSDFGKLYDYNVV